MADIDLVPVRYHRRRSCQQWILRSAIVYFLVAAALLGLRGLLDHRASSYDREIATIQQEQQRAAEIQRTVEKLEGVHAALGQRLAVLDGLRGGIQAKRMFKVIDDSLSSDVWFRSWSFRRAGEMVDGPDRAVETGYFIVLPQEAGEETSRAWRLQTHMEFTAEAEDHTALAGFVRQLSQRPEIEKARILNTRAQTSAAERIEFELAVVVRSTR